MAVDFYPETMAAASWDFGSGATDKEYREILLAASTPYHVEMMTALRYTNKVWDATRGEWVRWTTDHIDYTGKEYPHPLTWGSVTMYGVERIVEGAL
jgi:hypothetical protein